MFPRIKPTTPSPQSPTSSPARVSAFIGNKLTATATTIPTRIRIHRIRTIVRRSRLPVCHPHLLTLRHHRDELVTIAPPKKPLRIWHKVEKTSFQRSSTTAGISHQRRHPRCLGLDQHQTSRWSCRIILTESIAVAMGEGEPGWNTRGTWAVRPWAAAEDPGVGHLGKGETAPRVRERRKTNSWGFAQGRGICSILD